MLEEQVKLYFDYKSPYAYLAKDPADELPSRYRIELRWIPFLLRLKGKGERSIYSEYKARYSYMDGGCGRRRRISARDGAATVPATPRLPHAPRRQGIAVFPPFWFRGGRCMRRTYFRLAV